MTRRTSVQILLNASVRPDDFGAGNTLTVMS